MELNAHNLTNFLIWCRNQHPAWTLQDISDTRAHGFATLWIEFCQSGLEPVNATRIEFCYRASGAHVGVWWQDGLYRLDLFNDGEWMSLNNGQWMNLISKPGYSSIPQFIAYCLEDATPSETDNEL